MKDLSTQALDLIQRIETRLATPAYFREILDVAADQPYRRVLAAWSEVRTRHALQRDDHGRYFLRRADAL